MEIDARIAKLQATREGILELQEVSKWGKKLGLGIQQGTSVQ